MPRFLLIALLHISAISFAEPYRLKLLSEKKTQVEERVQTERTYAVEGSPFRLVQSTMGQGAVEIHSVEVFRGEQTNLRAAYSEFFVFRENGGTMGTLKAYRRFDDSPEAKGLGTIVLQPLIDLKEVSHIRAELAHTNFSRMTTELDKRRLAQSTTNFNDVVMTHSHLGQVLAQAGFDVAAEETSMDKFRPQVAFSFRTLEKPADISTCAWLVGKLATAVQFFRRRRP